MHDEQHYTLGSASIYLSVVSKIVRWLRPQQVHSLSQLTLQQLKAAHRYFRPRDPATSGGVRVLEQFLRAKGTVPEGEPPAPSPTEVQMERFAAYLRETRGLAQKTITGHCLQLRAFLKFLHFDRRRSQLRELQPRHVEDFLRQSARTNNRYSLQHVVATIRAFLKWRHALGLLSRPLHLQIDTPRVYRGEQLPRALPRAQVQALLQSINQSDAFGQRDFTLLYLAAAYGLRSGELVRLTLDDIDWRSRTLHIRRLEDLDSAALTYAEVKAIASGNPLVIEKAQVDSEIAATQKASELDGVTTRSRDDEETTRQIKHRQGVRV